MEKLEVKSRCKPIYDTRVASYILINIHTHTNPLLSFAAHIFLWPQICTCAFIHSYSIQTQMCHKLCIFLIKFASVLLLLCFFCCSFVALPSCCSFRESENSGISMLTKKLFTAPIQLKVVWMLCAPSLSPQHCIND